MTNVVYVDVLIALNLMINFVILSTAARFSGMSIRPLHTLLGAVVGAAGALSIFFPSMGVVLGGICKLVLCAVMVLIAFRPGTFWAFIRAFCMVFFVSFAFAGIMMAVYIWIGPRGMVVYNGIVYFGVRPLALLLLTALSYAVVEGVSRITRRRQAPEELGRMRIVMSGRSVTLTVLFDTGNNLCEPFSGLPVVVCGYRDISPIVPEYILEYLNYRRSEEAQPGLRLVPFRTIKGRGALPAFRPDRVFLSQKGHAHIMCDLYVAVTLDPVGDERYEAIANPSILAHQSNKVGEYV